MACKVCFTHEAEMDIESIVRYMLHSLASSAAASDFLNKLDTVVEQIAEHPLMYPLSTEPRLTAMGYHKALINRYILLYRMNGNDVVVAHVFHSSQNYAKLV